MTKRLTSIKVKYLNSWEKMADEFKLPNKTTKQFQEMSGKGRRTKNTPNRYVPTTQSTQNNQIIGNYFPRIKIYDCKKYKLLGPKSTRRTTPLSATNGQPSTAIRNESNQKVPDTRKLLTLLQSFLVNDSVQPIHPVQPVYSKQPAFPNQQISQNQRFILSQPNHLNEPNQPNQRNLEHETSQLNLSNYPKQLSLSNQLILANMQWHLKNSTQQNKPILSQRIKDKFRCTHEGCNKMLLNKRTLRKHLRYHMPRPYVCEQCGRGYVERCYLMRHMVSQHTNKQQGEKRV